MTKAPKKAKATKADAAEVIPPADENSAGQGSTEEVKDWEGDAPDLSGVTGNPDLWQTLHGWANENFGFATSAMVVPGGCLVRASKQFYNDKGALVACSESTVFVPNATIGHDAEHNCPKLVS